MTQIPHYLPFVFIFAFSGGLLFVIYQIFLGRNKDKLSGDKRFPRQIAFILLAFIVFWVLVLFLPIDAGARAEISTILGVVFSALVALSSTTMLSNIMAGLVLRITRPFNIGDFIRVERHFGRVSERGLFDTELQTEERAFVSIPNAYLIKNPISAIHASGTMVSVTLSLGYDVHHKQIEPLLLMAAEKAQLEKPFVHILALGDFSVTYRISGFLAETKHYVSCKSRLFACVLDELHESGIEILSPNFMAQRPTDAMKKVIPAPIVSEQIGDEKRVETVIFDKAEKAENIERFKKELLDEIAELKAQGSNRTADKQAIARKIDSKEALLDRLAQLGDDD